MVSQSTFFALSIASRKLLRPSVTFKAIAQYFPTAVITRHFFAQKKITLFPVSPSNKLSIEMQ